MVNRELCAFRIKTAPNQTTSIHEPRRIQPNQPTNPPNSFNQHNIRWYPMNIRYNPQRQFRQNRKRWWKQRVQLSSVVSVMLNVRGPEYEAHNIDQTYTKQRYINPFQYKEMRNYCRSAVSYIRFPPWLSNNFAVCDIWHKDEPKEARASASPPTPSVKLRKPGGAEHKNSNEKLETQ